MTAQPHLRLTVSDYFHNDQHSQDKLEYFYGTIESDL